MGDELIFGDLRLSPSSLTVACHDHVTVQPLVMNLLVALAESEAVVSREALDAALWKNAHVGYHSLPRAVSQARRAIAAAGSRARIEAVPKRGYRLVAAAPAAPLTPAAASSTPRAVPWHFWAALVAAIGLVTHAAGLHGSAWHLLALSAIAFWLALATARPMLVAGWRAGGAD